MNIVVDTNVIVAAMIKRGIVRDLLVRHPGTFLTPEACIHEVWECRTDWNRKGVPENEIADDLSWLVERVLIVFPRSAYRHREREASVLIPDPDDVPVVALGLSVENEGIWTFNTKDFSGSRLGLRVRVLTTARVGALLSNPREGA